MSIGSPFGLCLTILPIDFIDFVKFTGNSDENVATCSRFDVEEFPTIMMIKDGMFQIYNGSFSLPDLRDYADNRGDSQLQWKKLPEGGSIALFFIFLKELKVAAIILHAIALEYPITSLVLIFLFVFLFGWWLVCLNNFGKRIFEAKPYVEYNYESQGDTGIMPRSEDSKRRRKAKLE